MKTGRLLATGAGLGLLALGVADAAYRVRDWGAVDGEVAAVLPGDELVGDPADVTTLAVRVAAPARQVWRELVASAAGRPGQGLALGDVVRLSPRGPGEPPLRLARIVPGRALVLTTDEPAGPSGVWSFHVVPTGDGRCRLLFRRRLARAGLVRVVTHATEPVTVVLTRRALQGIAERAEAAQGSARRGTESAAS